MRKNTKKVEDFLIETALKIARDRKGCLLILRKGKLNYELQMENDIKPFNVLENGRRLEPLALQSGACIIDEDGTLIAYSVKVLKTKKFPNFGTRHSAGYTASLTGNISILASDDDLKVRIFKDGKLIIQLDPFEKGIDENIPEVTDIIGDELVKSVGVGTIGSLGLLTIAPAVGITFIGGVILFGSPYFIAKLLRNRRLNK